MHLCAFLRYLSFSSSLNLFHNSFPSFISCKAFSFAFSCKKHLKAPAGLLGLTPLTKSNISFNFSLSSFISSAYFLYFSFSEFGNFFHAGPISANDGGSLFLSLAD